mmetsp:Transcript_32501/g.95800  ORF Transcript_32501/g.95800 Transcript_32501/m.95800 type:complete len:289 (-) Transcript_32501:131-997(-)
MGEAAVSLPLNPPQNNAFVFALLTMDTTSANANSVGASSPEVQAPIGGQTESSSSTSFIGPLGPVDATSTTAAGAKGRGESGEASVPGAQQDGGEDDDDDDDAMMDDLAEVELHIPLHNIMGGDDSESSDDSDSRTNGTGAPSDAVMARAPSLANGWDDHAVTSCFDRAIQTHSMTAEELVDETNAGWEAGPNVLPPVVRSDDLDLPKKNGGAVASANSTKIGTTAKQQALCESAKTIEVTTSISDHFRDDNNNAEGDQKEPWRPRPLPLPVWAVDPVYAAACMEPTE